MPKFFLPPIYDKKAFIWSCFGLFFLMLAMKVTGGAGFVLIFPFVLAGFGKDKTALLLWSILTTAAFTMANPNLFPKDIVFGFSTKILYLMVGGIMSLQIIGRRKSSLFTPLLSLFFFLAYMAIVSSVGWMPMISYLKLTLFIITFLAFYSVGTAAATREVAPETLRSILLSFAGFYILGSIALLPFPGIATLSAEKYLQLLGFIPEGSLFMGITNQSQALGPIIAIFAALLLADWLFAVRRWNWLYALLLACTPILIYKTGSRTAMGTYLAALMFVGFFFMRARGVGSRWKSRALTVLFSLGLLGCVALFATPGMRAKVREFVFKWRGNEVVTDNTAWEDFTSSRQGLVNRMKENIAESPLIGNGFQVSKEQAELRVSKMSQILSAPIEKGVWIYAVVEEGGAFGMILFLIFLLVSFSLLLKRQAYIGASLLFVMMVSNLGEFTFFSVSGLGGLYWSMIFAALAIDAQRIRRLQREQYFAMLAMMQQRAR